jgi:hypothetical protein
MFLGDGEADARKGIRFAAIENLEQEQRSPALLAVANGKKLRPAFQPPGSCVLIR